MNQLGMRVKDAAKAVGVGERTMRDLVATGEVESVLIRGCRVIPTDALTRYMQQLRAGQSGEAA